MADQVPGGRAVRHPTNPRLLRPVRTTRTTPALDRAFAARRGTACRRSSSGRRGPLPRAPAAPRDTPRRSWRLHSGRVLGALDGSRAPSRGPPLDDRVRPRARERSPPRSSAKRVRRPASPSSEMTRRRGASKTERFRAVLCGVPRRRQGSATTCTAAGRPTTCGRRLLLADNAYLFGRSSTTPTRRARCVASTRRSPRRATDRSALPTPDGWLVGVRLDPKA